MKKTIEPVKKLVKKEVTPEVIETPVRSELDELRELHAKLTNLGINRIGQLENKIAELSQ